MVEDCRVIDSRSVEIDIKSIKLAQCETTHSSFQTSSLNRVIVCLVPKKIRCAYKVYVVSCFPQAQRMFTIVFTFSTNATLQNYENGY